MKMKNLVIVLMFCLSANVCVQAQDVYICTTVLFCNENGNCVEIEICDIVESVIDELRNPFQGIFKQKSSVLGLGGFPKSFENRTVYIKKGTKILSPEKTATDKDLIGRQVEPGKYVIKNGYLKLGLGE